MLREHMRNPMLFMFPADGKVIVVWRAITGGTNRKASMRTVPKPT